MEFVGFQKIARLSRGCCVSEKIDGTNAQVCITSAIDSDYTDTHVIGIFNGLAMRAGSRTRWITPDDDNYGFARWVSANQVELFNLGEGQHFGEWWGQGIQRNYGLKEKRFSLFNTSRWNENNPPPACCHVVPVLYEGIFTSTAVDIAIEILKQNGSSAAPGFMNPEGVVVYQTAGRCYFKKTILRDEEPKSKQKEE
jgi:hypothetical protein